MTPWPPFLHIQTNDDKSRDPPGFKEEEEEKKKSKQVKKALGSYQRAQASTLAGPWEGGEGGRPATTACLDAGTGGRPATTSMFSTTTRPHPRSPCIVQV